MIRKEQVFPLILRACPSFQGSWDRLDDEDKALDYLIMGDLARHLLSLYLNRQKDEFGPLCEIVERLLIEGDPYVRELVTVGLLEDIQNSWGRRAKKFYESLLPESRKWWKELEDFWSGRVPYVGAGLLAPGTGVSIKGWTRTGKGEWRRQWK